MAKHSVRLADESQNVGKEWKSQRSRVEFGYSLQEVKDVR